MRRNKRGSGLKEKDSEDGTYSSSHQSSEGESGIEQSTLRIRFTPEEDERLKELVKDVENNRWEKIAQKMPGRTARQCRDRYNNYLFKEISNEPWTEQEDTVILRMYKEIGPKWTQIAQHLQGRSGNNVKNRWYKHLKKVGRIRESKHKSIEPQLPLPVDIDKIWANLENELSFNNDYETSFRFD